MQYKVLLFGSNGMLGQAIKREFIKYDFIEVVCVAHDGADYNFDFTDDKAVKECFNSVQPDIVINTAAIVNLQLCEDNVALAYKVNARFCAVLTDCAQANGSYLIHISTDHFYHGDSRKKHAEADPIVLLNEYARTKYLGERLTQTYSNSLVIRTNIVGFRLKKEMPTFLEWVVKTIKQNEKMTLFDDFYTSSIFVDELACILIKIIEKRPLGIMNIASSTVSSKKEFILALSEALFGRLPLYDVGSVNYSLVVKRADSLGLDVSKAEKILECKMPDLYTVIKDIQKSYRRIENEI